MIEPFTTIKGSTRIGEGCRVRHSYLVDCVLEDGVERRAVRLSAPRHRAAPGAKVGTFVEVKNSDVGAGAKVPHLSYIGDADVGERTNLGAATITANYDGREKHRTKIGSSVRGGVDTTFVAPVSGRRRRVHGGRLGGHRGRAARRAGGRAASARRTSRASPSSERSPDSSRPEPPLHSEET